MNTVVLLICYHKLFGEYPLMLRRALSIAHLLGKNGTDLEIVLTANSESMYNSGSEEWSDAIRQINDHKPDAVFLVYEDARNQPLLLNVAFSMMKGAIHPTRLILSEYSEQSSFDAELRDALEHIGCEFITADQVQQGLLPLLRTEASVLMAHR